MMYMPEGFAEPSEARLHAYTRRQPLATLACSAKRKIEVSHGPRRMDKRAVPLRGRRLPTNPPWRGFSSCRNVLAMFQGPHHDVSPFRYREHPSVPNWNHAAAHAQGTPRLVEDAGEGERMLAELAATHEPAMSAPWRMDLACGCLDSMLTGVVSFAVPIPRLQ